MDGSIAAGWGVAFGVLVAAAFAAPSDGRVWARRAVALLALYLIAFALAAALLPPAWLAWAAALAAVAVLLTIQPFVALGVMAPAEMGLNAPRTDSARVVVIAIGLALLINVVVMLVRGAAPGRIVAGTIDAVLASVAPGRTTADLDAVAEAYIRDQGAIPSFLGYGRPPFPASICTSLNDEIVHGIPSPKRVLKEGDLLSLDFGAIWEGFHGDSAVTVFVGEPTSSEAEKLVRVTEEALNAAISQIRPGGRLSDISNAVEQTALGAGFEVVREYVGHGIGRNLHEDPQIPNYGSPGRGPELRPGLVVAVEPMVNMGGWETTLLADQWTVVTADGSLSAHFEHTIAVTEDGAEVLTSRD
jgi:methionyl aminopeptidase